MAKKGSSKDPDLAAGDAPGLARRYAAGTQEQAPAAAASAQPPMEKRWWQKGYALFGIAVTIAAGIMGLWLFWDKLRTVRPANVGASLASCQSDEIRLVLRNSGGRAARIDRPRFQIRSPLARAELPINVFVAEDPFNAAVRERGTALKGGDRQELLYEGRVPFFSEQESASGRCTISVRVAVVPDSGRHPDVEAQCRCGS